VKLSCLSAIASPIKDKTDNARANSYKRYTHTNTVR
jgi:hypothetical protein